MAVTEDRVGAYADLVRDDPGAFRVHGAVFTDPDVFAAEMDRIFERSWVYVGHSSELAAPGDYKTVVVGTQPVILSRHEDGRIYALYNRCRHRGAVVCRQERGHSNFFRCRYHNWVYANNGALIGMAQSTGYPDDFDRSRYGLVPVGRLESYRGLLFVNLSSEGASLAEHLAPVRRYIDWWFGRSPVEAIVVSLPPHRYEYPGNWKLQAENGADGYHGNYVHLSWQRVLALSKESSVEETQQYRQAGCTRGLAGGHGVLERPGSLNPNSSWTARMMHRYPEYAEAMRARYGDDQLLEISARRNIFVFPNLYLFETHLRVIVPKAVDRTEVQLYVYALEGVPDAINQGRFRGHERFFGPAGFGSPDDIEVFTEVQSGVRARGEPWNLLNRGQHRERYDAGEWIGHTTDEAPQRALYRQWQRLMARR
ncbi:MAG: Rieske 2Fe-2S domain-containing protein [Armatimonadota bacterium]|nr:Rieske 2Fe-2S domain-containing protein [Armatimonadota bacterium]MDR7533759.1 Rieske 2Fe-2S domain-containing protein [Armatimonadota bacterium]MDR7535749.1 Rieske 2Fe-2S domain-containing protein [Armatimonadota bacterium]